MALAVARTIEEGGALVVEAGTGVGKTFSYLVPALLSGERVLLSTATKTLQDQLFGRDLPRLVEALGLPVRTALLKGRGSYLCLHRLELARQDAALPERSIAAHAGQDRAMVAGHAHRRPGRAAGAGRALAADPAGHLHARKLPGRAMPAVPRLPRQPGAPRGAGGRRGGHQPPPVFCRPGGARVGHGRIAADACASAIFDEAHQLNETGVQFLGAQLATGQVLDFARDMLAAGLQHGARPGRLAAAGGGVERAARELRLAVGKHWPGAQAALDRRSARRRRAAELAGRAGRRCKRPARRPLEALATVSEIAPDFVRLHERAAAAGRAGAALCAAAARPESVRWVDVGTQLRLVESPLDIAEAVQHTGAAGPARSEATRRAWIFTSATLGDDARLRWFTEPAAWPRPRCCGSAARSTTRARRRCTCRAHLPKPDDPAHSAAGGRSWRRAALRRLGGRTLVLTTTLRALRSHRRGHAARISTACRPTSEVLVQGQLPKRALMERFREGACAGRAGCVLVASASFWEGIDVPGDALQLVMIDKLPFPPPNDPLVEARSQRLEAQGRSAFNDYFVPEAAVALKQGAGRLIRRETDRGVLVVCDTRLAAMGYGRRLLAALPPMRRLAAEGEFAWTRWSALNCRASGGRALTRPSTTDRPGREAAGSGTRSSGSSSPSRAWRRRAVGSCPARRRTCTMMYSASSSAGTSR